MISHLSLIILISILQICSAYFNNGYYISDLETSDLSNEYSSWTFSQYAVSTSYGSRTFATLASNGMPAIRILGGPNKLGVNGGSAANQYITRSYSGIKTHSYVGISFRIWYFDNWSPRNGLNGIKWKIDTTEMPGPRIDYTNDFVSYEGGDNTVGGSFTKDCGYVRIKAGTAHTGSTMTFQIYGLLTGENGYTRFGIRDVVFVFSQNVVTPALQTCHISEEGTALKYDTCTCGASQAQDAAGTGCDSCFSECSSCFVGKPDECLLCDNGLYWTGTDCCNVNCRQCTGSTDDTCPDCYSTSYNYGNNTCKAACPSSFVVSTVGDQQMCTKRCTSTQFFYGFNSTCWDACPLPFSQSYNAGDDINNCFNPCSTTTQYLFTNGSCTSTCPAPLLSRSEPGVRFCWNPCPNPDTDFLHTNGSCLATCPAPLASRTDSGVIYCYSPCNPSTQWLFSNGTCWSSCPLPFASRTEAGVKYCYNPCTDPSTGFLFPNGSCLSTCPITLWSRSEPGVNYCWNPCSVSTQYLFTNQSCISTCPSPLMSRTEGSFARFCWNPCANPDTDYLFPNRTCFGTCLIPLWSRTEPGVNYCWNPCSVSTQYLFTNQSCLTNCPSPLVARTEGSFARFCWNPCSDPDNQFLYTNGTCDATCPFPLFNRVESGVKYCYTICTSSQWLFDNQTCVSSCPSPLLSRIESFARYCWNPCSDPDNQFLYYNGSCLATCPPPLKSRSEWGVNPLSAKKRFPKRIVFLLNCGMDQY